MTHAFPSIPSEQAANGPLVVVVDPLGPLGDFLMLALERDPENRFQPIRSTSHEPSASISADAIVVLADVPTRWLTELRRRHQATEICVGRDIPMLFDLSVFRNEVARHARGRNKS